MMIMERCLKFNNTDITRNWSYPDPSDHNASSVRIMMSVFLTFFGVIAILCNVLVIGIIIKKRLFKQPTILLFLNLLITNLFFCIAHLPFAIVTSTAGEFIFGSTDSIRCIVCYVDGVIFISLSIEIGWNIVLISVDRFVYLYKPLRYSDIITVKRTMVAIILTLVHTIAFSIPPFFGFGGFLLAGRYLPLCSPYSVDRANNRKINPYWLLLIFALVIPLLLLVIVVNICIVCIICKNLRRNHHRLNKVRRKYSNFQKQQVRLFQVFGALFIGNILIYIPFIAYVMTSVATKREFLQFLTFAHIAFNSQTLVHPLIQALLIKDIRTSITKFFCCLPKIKLSMQYCGCEACNAAIMQENQVGMNEGQVVHVTA